MKRNLQFSHAPNIRFIESPSTIKTFAAFRAADTYNTSKFKLSASKIRQSVTCSYAAPEVTPNRNRHYSMRRTKFP